MANAPTKPGEGSLSAPIRYTIDWQDEAFYDFDAIEREMERVFDICHGCRRCFNLCDSFPRLFDLVDESPDEIAGVAKADYKQVVDACTLCDMCFMTKCPYVPPHEWALDFPHLMLRYRAAELKRSGGKAPLSAQLAQTDRNGQLARPIAALANFASDKDNWLTRKPMEAILGVDAHVELPKYHFSTFTHRAALEPPPVNPEGRARGRKAVLYATCFVEYNNPATGMAAQAVLAKLGVETKVVYPVCCGMPQFEHGDLAEVAKRAERVAAEMAPYIADGYDIIALTASCGLMLKFEWPLIVPKNEAVKQLSAATRDIDEYVVDIAKTEGLAPGLAPMEGAVTAHQACHARAQNMGAKSAEMLRLIPGAKVDVLERCSGHGGTFGVMKETHPVAVKVGRPAARQAAAKHNGTLCSDCPLACKHLAQLMVDEFPDGAPETRAHPIEVFARAYGLM